jgi:hypothetical protein
VKATLAVGSLPKVSNVTPVVHGCGVPVTNFGHFAPGAPGGRNRSRARSAFRAGLEQAEQLWRASDAVGVRSTFLGRLGW